ncbi:class F sortase [Kribbella qitaiheensis]|uniref:Class F sortase n=2 Tax=Kribbella qitaiheensis TaxID=1544730 RepID=A0A7G6X952_9ACTN|nr:class F sortase [Kribbella qitaiheensis]
MQPETNAPANQLTPAPQTPTIGPVNPTTSSGVQRGDQGPDERASPAARSGNAGPDGPKLLLLPQIAVSARVIPIAAEDGILTPPSNPRVVGWWSAGARPGADIGSAVLTAHTVHTGGGAFDDLGKLRMDATVTVLTSTARINYRVTSVTHYPKQSLAKHATELFDQTTPGRLVLVTCEDWNGKDYLSNTVVIAEPR